MRDNAPHLDYNRLGLLRCSKCNRVTVTGAPTFANQARLDRPDLCRDCWLVLNGLQPGSLVSRRRRQTLSRSGRRPPSRQR
jgi:hypothetical protein